MFDNTLHIPLRFYSALEKQDRFKAYATTKRFNQWTDTTHLPPFQLKVALSTASATIALVTASTDVSTGNITPTIYFEDFATAAYTYLIYQGASLSAMPGGDFYLHITAGSDHFYSEVFSVGDVTDKTIIEYYGVNDIGGIDYSNTGHSQYKSKIILDDVTLAKPEYLIEEEAVEDGDGNQIPIFQRRVKLFKMWFYAPEYIVDAISLISLHDYVTLTTHNGESDQETGLVYDFNMTAEWNESKGLAKITCEFRDSPVIKTTCANNLV
jgi:hypothetical protein